ncbi:MAG TPA: exosortase family protein XrtG, partial [Clostridia bacterium]|nr:exosortase family protein XrtG [Clostridia bacterium]
ISTFGGDTYFYAHTIIGRLFFYGCTIVLYFQVFTKSQIIRQKIGRFDYDMDGRVH